MVRKRPSASMLRFGRKYAARKFVLFLCCGSVVHFPVEGFPAFTLRFGRKFAARSYSSASMLRFGRKYVALNYSFPSRLRCGRKSVARKGFASAYSVPTRVYREITI